jgi:hypothetical protein
MFLDEVRNEDGAPLRVHAPEGILLHAREYEHELREAQHPVGDQASPEVIRLPEVGKRAAESC